MYDDELRCFLVTIKCLIMLPGLRVHFMNSGVYISAVNTWTRSESVTFKCSCSERVLRTQYEHPSHVHNNVNASVQNS